MLFSALLYALVPVWVGFGNAGASPFFFTAISHAAAIPCVFLYIQRRRSKWDVLNWKSIKAALGYQPRNHRFWVYLSALGICTTSYAFFSMASESLEYSNLPIVAAVYEAWPVLAIVAIFLWPHLGSQNGDSGNDSGNLGFGEWVTLAIALFGLGFVISARESISLMHLISNLSLGEWEGISLAFVSSFLAAGIVVLTLGHGQALSNSTFRPDSTEGQKDAKDQKVDCTVNCTMLIVIFMHIAGFAISASLALMSGESFPGIYDSGFAISMGVTVGAGAISFRVASINSENPAITALSFFTPLFALAILLGLGWFGISEWDYSLIRWDYLAMGATAIFSANLLLNMRADLRTGYRSLVLCLWAFGAIRYLYGGIPWDWYYESIAVVTGILAITVGFRSERFVRRTQAEEALSIEILHALTWLIDKHRSEYRELEEARRAFLSAHSPENSKTMRIRDRNSHMRMVEILRGLRRKINFEHDHETISKCLRKADELILSRAHGGNFGEKIAIFGMACASAGIALFLRNTPPVDSAGSMEIDALVGNFFSLLVGPVAIFLYYHVVDLEKDRSRKIYDEEKLAKQSDFQIVREIHDRGGERFIASMILILTFAIYAWLFLVKHL